MGKRIYDFIDLSDRRKVFAVGDIHGCFDLLRQKLQEVGFDGDKDTLVSVGDLVDRGPLSHEAMVWAQFPWFKRVIGNHEEMTQDHIDGNSYLHTINGGGWLADMPDEEKREHVRVLLDAPYLLEVKTSQGLNVGFAHADLAWADWEANREAPDVRTFTWSRMGVKQLVDPDYQPIVRGIDKVFFGHNALYKPYSRGNCNWIDTGCGFQGGNLTVVDVDLFGNKAE